MLNSARPVSTDLLLNNFQCEATYKKNDIFYNVVKDFSIKDKRRLFAEMKNCENINVNTFFPRYAFTVGEFALWTLLTERNKKKAKKNQ